MRTPDSSSLERTSSKGPDRRFSRLHYCSSKVFCILADFRSQPAQTGIRTRPFRAGPKRTRAGPGHGEKAPATHATAPGAPAVKVSRLSGAGPANLIIMSRRHHWAEALAGSALPYPPQREPARTQKSLAQLCTGRARILGQARPKGTVLSRCPGRRYRAVLSKPPSRAEPCRAGSFTPTARVDHAPYVQGSPRPPL